MEKYFGENVPKLGFGLMILNLLGNGLLVDMILVVSIEKKVNVL